MLLIMSNAIVDFRVILLEYAKSNKYFHDTLMEVKNVRQLNRHLLALILFKRIIKRDCLENGWTLVGYVTNVVDLKIMETFYVIPISDCYYIQCQLDNKEFNF